MHRLQSFQLRQLRRLPPLSLRHPAVPPPTGPSLLTGVARVAGGLLLRLDHLPWEWYLARERQRSGSRVLVLFLGAAAAVAVASGGRRVGVDLPEVRRELLYSLGVCALRANVCAHAEGADDRVGEVG